MFKKRKREWLICLGVSVQTTNEMVWWSRSGCVVVEVHSAWGWATFEIFFVGWVCVTRVKDEERKADRRRKAVNGEGMWDWRRRNVWDALRFSCEGVEALWFCSEEMWDFALQFSCERERHMGSRWVECWRKQKLWDEFDNSLSWAHVCWRKLPNCHHYSVSIIQKHQKLASSFHYSSLNWAMKTKNQNKFKQVFGPWDPPILSYGWWKLSDGWWKQPNPNSP